MTSAMPTGSTTVLKTGCDTRTPVCSGRARGPEPRSRLEPGRRRAGGRWQRTGGAGVSAAAGTSGWRRARGAAHAAPGCGGGGGARRLWASCRRGGRPLPEPRSRARYGLRAVAAGYSRNVEPSSLPQDGPPANKFREKRQLPFLSLVWHFTLSRGSWPTARSRCQILAPFLCRVHKNNLGNFLPFSPFQEHFKYRWDYLFLGCLKDSICEFLDTVLSF